MEFILKNETTTKTITSISDELLDNKLFFFSEISEDLSGELYLEKTQISQNIQFDCLFPSNTIITKLFISNVFHPFFCEKTNNEIDNVTFSKQSFYITKNSGNISVFSTLQKYKNTIE